MLAFKAMDFGSQYPQAGYLGATDKASPSWREIGVAAGIVALVGFMSYKAAGLKGAIAGVGILGVGSFVVSRHMVDAWSSTPSTQPEVWQ